MGRSPISTNASIFISWKCSDLSLSVPWISRYAVALRQRTAVQASKNLSGSRRGQLIQNTPVPFLHRHRKAHASAPDRRRAPVCPRARRSPVSMAFSMQPISRLPGTDFHQRAGDDANHIIQESIAQHRQHDIVAASPDLCAVKGAHRAFRNASAGGKRRKIVLSAKTLRLGVHLFGIHENRHMRLILSADGAHLPLIIKRIAVNLSQAEKRA